MNWLEVTFLRQKKNLKQYIEKLPGSGLIKENLEAREKLENTGLKPYKIRV